MIYRAHWNIPYSMAYLSQIIAGTKFRAALRPNHSRGLADRGDGEISSLLSRGFGFGLFSGMSLLTPWHFDAVGFYRLFIIVGVYVNYNEFIFYLFKHWAQ